MPSITVDLHTHLLEKEVKPESYWKAVKARKLDAVAITEHFDKKPEKAFRMLEEKRPRGIGLIPGVELSTEIGHVLALSKGPEIYNEESLFRKGIGIGEAIETAEKRGIMLSIAHPWGLSYDSAAYIYGEKRLERLVEGKRIGVEAFNGMFGNVSSFFYESNWVQRPMRFFDRLEKSRIGRKTRLSRIGSKGKEKLGKKGREIIERGQKPYELAEKAAFATAGSDAHSPQRIGSGIAKIQAEGNSPEQVLEAIGDKERVEWLGPDRNSLETEKAGIRRTEVLSGLKYATKSAIIKKVKRKGKKK